MLISEIETALASLNPVGLSEISNIGLMNRIDTKYLLPVTRFPDLIYLLKGDYRVLEIEKARVSTYNTTYLDTPEFLFYYQHITGRSGRYKVRYREYESTGKTYLEIKKKTNKRRTIKWRIESSPEPEFLNGNSPGFIMQHVPVNYKALRPVLCNSFKRTTLVGINSKERITLDFNLTFFKPFNGSASGLEFLSIAELKRERYSNSSPFVNLIRKLNIQPVSFSKYCIGNVLINNPVRTNALKSGLLLINKIENEYYDAISH